jgi:bacterioferritin
MQGDRQIIQILNRQLTRELTAVNQYFLHARMYQQWGFGKLGEREYHESIEEMQHADKLVKRILMLEGLPNLQDLGKLHIGENVREMLGSDLELERGSQGTLKEGIAACETAKDYVSREILEDILDDTEDHIDWIETQLELVDKVGEQNYLQSQMGDESKS